MATAEVKDLEHQNRPTVALYDTAEISTVAADSAFAGSLGAKDTTKARVTTRSKLSKDFLLVGWNDASIWKSAFIEMVATMCLCYLSGIIDVTFANITNPNAIPAYVGISNTVLLSLFIYSSSPASGGHINPVLSFSTLLAGLTPLPRAVLYMIGQLSGAAVAGGLLRGSLGHDLTIKYHGGGCIHDTDLISSGQAFIIEFMSTFVLLFLAFGIGLDPRQARLFGLNGPLLVGLSLGLVTFAGSNIAPGYTGAAMNPARCFAFAVASSNFEGMLQAINLAKTMVELTISPPDQWIWWFGPAVGCVLSATLYSIVPPYHVIAK
ncbi:MAG: hypothetical protein M1820_005736 [Bogoriella megaspora]|nr:MAG: hypothetical protein M1820_005736 [Bogoriella megaspora]